MALKRIKKNKLKVILNVRNLCIELKFFISPSTFLSHFLTFIHIISRFLAIFHLFYLFPKKKKNLFPPDLRNTMPPYKIHERTPSELRQSPNFESRARPWSGLRAEIMPALYRPAPSARFRLWRVRSPPLPHRSSRDPSKRRVGAFMNEFETPGIRATSERRSHAPGMRIDPVFVCLPPEIGAVRRCLVPKDYRLVRRSDITERRGKLSLLPRLFLFDAPIRSFGGFRGPDAGSGEQRHERSNRRLVWGTLDWNLIKSPNLSTELAE